jgi:hypothetical protein
MLNVLVILHAAALRAGTIREHVAALTRLPRHRVFKVDHANAHRVDFAAFDVIALHYSLVIASPAYISDLLREKIASFRGLKVLFIQDEYRWIDATARAIGELGIRVVFSLVESSLVRQVYHHPFLADVRFEYTLTGYVSPALLKQAVPAYERRSIDVGYRARKLSAWYGSHALQKWQIADAFVEAARPFGLNLDISTREEDRLYGRRWMRLLANCKACLGTESGASVLDYTDEIRRNVEAFVIDHPKAGFEELRRRFFADHDGRVVMNVISPRCLEAAALRTLMVMYPGDYSGILEAGRHYVVLQKDHSNIAEVVEIIRSPARARPFIECAYREIACSDRLSLAALGRHFERVIDEEGVVARNPGASAVALGLRVQLAVTVAVVNGRARMMIAEWAMRLEHMALAAARRVLPEDWYWSLVHRAGRLRRTAKRLILRIP